MNAVLQRPWLLGGGNRVPPGATLGLGFMTPGVLDPRITFTRASTGTYFDSAGVLQTAATNAPRWDYDPNTRVLKGLLIEEARTNLVLQSGDYTQAAWTKTNMTFAAGVPGPNGPTTGNGCISASGQVAFAYQVFTSTPATTYCASCFFKAGSLSLVQMVMPPQWWANATSRFAIFDLSNGTINSVVGGGAVSLISPAGNGWYRCSLIATPDTAASAALQINRANANGDGVTVQHYAFGAQFEAGAFPTSYIPTVGSSVTRAADVATMSTAGWYVSQVGTLSFEALTPVAQSKARTWLSLETGASRTAVAIGGANNINIVDTAAVLNLATVPEPIGSVFRTAFAFSNGAQRAVTNGGAGVTAALTPMVANATLLAFGNSPAASGTQVNAWLRQVKYWPRALSQAELIQVTRGF